MNISGKIKDELNKFEADPYDSNSYKLRQPTDDIQKLMKIYGKEDLNFMLPSKQEIMPLRNFILKEKIRCFRCRKYKTSQAK